MLDLIGTMIGWGSVAVIVLMFRYAHHFENGNIERYDDDKDRTRREAILSQKPKNVGDSLRTELRILADFRNNHG
ncbi:hypothetical protein RDp07_gp09 [Roseobacter phage RD-1410Ws-07]|uniref:Uncharacterized protein n=1 Tax=Roseobacter phage RD-1410Ws-07 TaxID=1815985 RepID=A0A191VYN1_9CAUD|nr:hypothetical protein RDp07_gp09 [Roseobacter phage RD-1410Ws-07]